MELEAGISTVGKLRVLKPRSGVPVPDLNVALRKPKAESGYGPGIAKSQNLTLILGTLALWN